MLIVKVLKFIPTIQDNMDLDDIIQYEQNNIMSFKLAHPINLTKICSSQDGKLDDKISF